MKVFKSLSELPDFQHTAITIGSFDGVHSGHQKIIEQLVAYAKKAGGESVLLTFHPHPRLVVNQDKNDLKLLTTVEEKIALLEKYGVQNVVFVPFSTEFANQSPEAYIEQFLVKYFRPKYVIVGYDHQFGKDRKGNFALLKKYETKGNFEVVEIEKQVIDDISISSSKIRTALIEKDLWSAERLLGHTFTLMGKVVKGQQIGRTMGFPTANLMPLEAEKLIPAIGIYAVWVTVESKRYGGMLYIGNRPTLTMFNNQTIEVNIFNFNEDIYDKIIQIDFVEFIREDKKFDNLEDLKMALGKDKIRAQYFLNPPKQVENPAIKSDKSLIDKFLGFFK
jgi:riboflavin kinase / FMN adenylyltransferase